MKLLPLILLASCQQVEIEQPPPESVVIVVDYGDIRKVYIKNDGIECWVYSNGELIKKEKY